MKKPVWIRVFAWLSVAGLLYLAAVAITAQSIVQSNPGSLRVIVALFLVFLSCFVVWAISSIIWKVRVSRAEDKALAGVEPYWRPAVSPQLSATRTPTSTSWQPSGVLDRPHMTSPQVGTGLGLSGGVRTATTPPHETVAGTPQIRAAQPGGPAVGGPNLPAQRVQEPSESRVYTYEAPGVPLCLDCRERPGVFYCLQHSKFLCLQCVAPHDQPDTCQYVPAFRGKRDDRT